MLWVVLSLLLVVADTARSMYAKTLTGKINASTVTFATLMIGAVLLLPITAWLGFPGIGQDFWLALAITAVLNAVATLLIYKAMKISELSQIAPLFSLSPFFVLITAPIFLNEMPTPMGLVGVLVIMLGTYALNFNGRVNLEPF